MYEYRNHHHHSHSHTPSMLIPKDNNINTSYLHNAPSLKITSKIAKDLLIIERPMTNRSQYLNEQFSSTYKQLDSTNRSIQRMLVDKTTSNLASGLYNSTVKVRDRDKGNLIMYKTRAKESQSQSQKPSPVRRGVKVLSPQRNAEEKLQFFDLSSPKSLRLNDSHIKMNDTFRASSRSKGFIAVEQLGSSAKLKQPITLNGAVVGTPASSQKYKLIMGPANSHTLSKNLPNQNDYELERNPQVSLIEHRQESPATNKQYEKSPKAVDISQHLELGKGNKANYRFQDIEFNRQEAPIEKIHSISARKLPRRGFSIDQAVQQVFERSRPKIENIRINPPEEEIILNLANVNDSRRHPVKEPESPHQIIFESEQEQIKYFEKLLDVDQMGFQFEKAMLKRRQMKQALKSPTTSRTCSNKPMKSLRVQCGDDSDNRSHTKSSGRWTTKRTGIEEFDSGAITQDYIE